MEERLSVNIAVVGAVSVGKSTLINAIFVDHYSDTKIKRTTAVPQVYDESDCPDKYSVLDKIREHNRQINDQTMQKTENGHTLSYDDIGEIHYVVPPIYDMLNEKLQQNVFLSIYDLPGLNDSATKNIYFDYVKNNFYKFDIIVLVLDINSGLNTADEIEILKLICGCIRKKKQTSDVDTGLIILLNKCDNMKEVGGNLFPTNDELCDMAVQAKKIIDTQINELCPNLRYTIHPISCEDAHIYRTIKKNPHQRLDDTMINKLGYNEYGKVMWNRSTKEEKDNYVELILEKSDCKERILCTGFTRFSDTISTILNKNNQYNFLTDHVKYELSQIRYTDFNIGSSLDLFKSCRNKLNRLATMFEKPNNCNNEMFNKHFTRFMEMFKSDNHQIFKKSSKTKQKNEQKYRIIKEIYIKIQTYFGDLWNDIYKKDFSVIIERINQYHIDCLDNLDITEQQMLNSFDTLQENKYEQFDDILYGRMICLMSYKYFHSNAGTDSDDSEDTGDNVEGEQEQKICIKKITNFLAKIEDRYNLPADRMIDILSVLCGKKIMHIQDAVTSMVISNFWKNIVIRSDNKHAHQINEIIALTTLQIYNIIDRVRSKERDLKLQKKQQKSNKKGKNKSEQSDESSDDDDNVFSEMVGFSNVTSEIDLLMERMMYERLKKMYPKKIYNHDDLIDQINRYHAEDTQPTQQLLEPTGTNSVQQTEQSIIDIIFR
jgi:predicted GTPase